MIDTAVILAAGRGSRLKEVTAHRSKALAPIAGKPIILRVNDSLADAGIRSFVVVGAPHDNELKELCASLPNTKFLVQEQPLGSANALQGAERLVPTTFIVCACDSLVPSHDIGTLIAHHAPDSAATLSIIEVAPDISLGARSVVAMEGDRITNIIEKPSPEERVSNLSSLPLYVLTHEIFAEISRLTPSSRGEYELPEAFRGLLHDNKVVRGVRATERYDLTDQRDLLALNKRFLSELSPALHVSPSATLPPSVKLIPPLIIEDGVTVGDNTTLGPLVYLERGSSVRSGLVVTNSVVLRNATVTTDCHEAVVA